MINKNIPDKTSVFTQCAKCYVILNVPKFVLSVKVTQTEESLSVCADASQIRHYYHLLETKLQELTEQ